MEKNIVIAQVGKTKGNQSVKYKKFYQNDPSSPSAYLPGPQDGGGYTEYTESRYSFHVILNELGKGGKKADALLLVGTPESSWENLCKFFSEQFGEDLGDLEGAMHPDGEGGITNMTGVRGLVEQFLSGCLDGTDVRILIQHNGITPCESGDNFNLILDMLTEILGQKGVGAGRTAQEANLHLDISNGFRSFPMYVFLAADYIAQIRPKRDFVRIFMYYGMFDKKLAMEGGHFVSSFKGDFVPYVDMGDTADIVQWTDAVAEFYNSGSVIQLLKILESNGLANTGADGKVVTDAFRKFNYAINTNNLKLLDETTDTLAHMRKKLDGRLPKYAEILLAHISDDFGRRFGGCRQSGTKYGLLSVKVAEWYLDQQRIGDAVVALQEGMITYAMERFPVKCETLINKKIESTNEIKSGALQNPGSRELFNFEYRETIQKHVFDTRDWDSVGWMKEYKYICSHLRDPDVRMQYNIAGQASLETDMGNAVKNIRELIRRVSKGELDAPMEEWIDQLLAMQEYDFFISYRRMFQEADDGKRMAEYIKYFLEKQTYIDKNNNKRNFEVFWDIESLSGTTGEFPPKIRHAIHNSMYVILLIGDKSFDRHYSESDYYYMEIQTATDKSYKKDIFVIPVCGFRDPEGPEASEDSKEAFKTFPETFKTNVRKFIHEYQLVNGGKVWDLSEKDVLCQSLIGEIRKNMNDKEKNKTDGRQWIKRP